MPDRYNVVCRARHEAHHGHEDYRSARAFAVNPCASGAPSGQGGLTAQRGQASGGAIAAMNAWMRLAPPSRIR